MKKILIIQGGGRPKGNTRQLVDAFAQGAAEAGHEVETISLNKIQVNGCLGCNVCRYGKPCIQKDGFNELVPKIKEADCIVSRFAFVIVRIISANRIAEALGREYDDGLWGQADKLGAKLQAVQPTEISIKKNTNRKMDSALAGIRVTTEASVGILLQRA